MKLQITILLLVINSIILAQPEISWIKQYDTGSQDEKGVSLTETNDNSGYIICAYRNTQQTIQDLYLIKTNEVGDTIWTKQYGMLYGSDYGMQILNTGDGYVIGGMQADSSILYFTAWLLKINEDGDTLWSETLLDSARIKSICLTPDGGISATGGKFFNGRQKLFIARFNPNGGLFWLNYYSHDNFYDSFGYDIICTQDSGFTVLGASTDSNTPTIAEPWLLKTDENGIVELDTVYNFSNNYYFFTDGNIKQTYNGNFILAEDLIGSVSFLKINPAGEILDSLNFTNEESSSRILQAADSNYILMYTTIFGSNDNISIIIEKTDQNFNNIWTKEISGNDDYIGWHFITTSDQRLLVTGWAQGRYTQNDNILLAKLEGDIIPVELLAFEGNVEANYVKLQWKTATEKNNYGFNIECSSDKTNWNEIGFVKGNITSTTPHTFSFIDSSLQTGTVYYRLKQIDLNGTYTYSNEIKIELSPLIFSLEQNYPNPFNPVTTISYSIPAQANVKLDVYNILGQKVVTLVNEFKLSGRYSIEFNAESFASGIYIYQLTSGNYTLTKKMLLLK
jgi:hypothetical protein